MLATKALDAAGKSLTFGSAANVYHVAHLKNVGLDDVAYIDGGTVVQFKLPQVTLHRQVVFGKVAFLGLVYVFVCDVAITDLHGFVSVVFDCLLLDDNTGARLHHGDRDNLAIFVKQLGHADFGADELLFCTGNVFLLQRLLVDRQFRPT
jgi:hypothetical protein